MSKNSPGPFAGVQDVPVSCQAYWKDLNSARKKTKQKKRETARFRGFIWNEKSMLFSPFLPLPVYLCKAKTTCFTQLSLPQGTVRQSGSVKTLIHWARWFEAFSGGTQVSPPGLKYYMDSKLTFILQYQLLHKGCRDKKRADFLVYFNYHPAKTLLPKENTVIWKIKYHLSATGLKLKLKLTNWLTNCCRQPLKATEKGAF